MDHARVVRYYVEPASLNEIKCFPRRIEAPTCCQRMDFNGMQPPILYTESIKSGVDVHPCAIRARNLVLPTQTSKGHICGAHCISDKDVLVCPAPWVHKRRIFPSVPAMCVDQQKYESMEKNWALDSQNEGQPIPNEKLDKNSLSEMPEPVFPPPHCNNQSSNFSGDVEMDTQRQLEEQIAHEILLLSQKLANLQARYGTRRLTHDNTKPAVLSCPQTPLLLDNPKYNACIPSINQSMNEDSCQQPRPTTSSSSRSTTHKHLNSRSQLEDHKLGGRHIGTNKRVPSIISSRGSDTEITIACNFNKNHSNSRASFTSQASGNNTIGSRLVEATLVQRWGKVLRETIQVGKRNNKSRTFSSMQRKGQKRELMDECSYSDDIKEHSRTSGANVQGYPDGNKRFDWMKTLHFGRGNVCENHGCVDFTSQIGSKPSSPQKEFRDIDAETWLQGSSEHECFPRETVISTLISKSVQAGGSFFPKEGVDTCAQTPIDLDDKHKPKSMSKKKPNSNFVDNRFGQPSKRLGSLDDMMGLDSRLAHHLVKVGLRRAPSFWRVPGIRPMPNATLKLKKKTFGSRSPKKDGGKHLHRKILFDHHLNCSPEEKIGTRKQNVNQQCELKVEPTRKSDEATDHAQWQKEVGDYEAEYETFVENTDVGVHNTLDSQEYTSVVNREALTSLHSSEEDGPKRSPSNCMVSTQEKARHSEVPVVSLTKPPPPTTKKTFIRCIELVVATKKKNQFSEINGCKACGIIGYKSHRRVLECSERPSCDVCGMDKDYHTRIHVIKGKHATKKMNHGHS